MKKTYLSPEFDCITVPCQDILCFSTLASGDGDHINLEELMKL